MLVMSASSSARQWPSSSVSNRTIFRFICRPNPFCVHQPAATKKDRQCDQPANSGRDDKRYEMSKFVSESGIDRR